MANDSYFSTQRAGNWTRPMQYADSPWYSSPEENIAGFVPGIGATVTIRHAVTIDAPVIIGGSYQAAIWAPLAVSTTGGSAVTSLISGGYTAAASVVSARGETQVGNSIAARFTLTAGVSKPRITFASAPPSGCTYSLYLDTPGSVGFPRTLYCAGITGNSVDLVGGSWGNTYSGGVASGGTTTQGNSTGEIPSGQASAITLTSAGSLAISAGQSLLVRGDLVVQSPTGSTKVYVTIGAGATFRTDPTQATDPTRADYLTWFQGGGDIRFTG